MIRVPKHDAGPNLPQVLRGESLDGSLRAYRHEGWRLHLPTRSTQDAGARLTVPCVYLYGDGESYRCLPPSRRSMASPNELKRYRSLTAVVYASRIRSSPPKLITIARSVERGRWKFVSSVSTHRQR